jgi:hypothetical protein
MHQINGVVMSQEPHPDVRWASSLRFKRNLSFLVDSMPELSYEDVTRSQAAIREDELLLLVATFLTSLERPQAIADDKFPHFVRFCMRFFVADDRLWRRDRHGAHKLVLNKDRRLAALRSCHDEMGHKGFFATRALLLERFWWPHIQEDIKWYVRSCHLCQERQLRLVRIPPVVAQPAPLFSKVYIDTMHLPPSNKFKYLIQGRCSLCTYPEFRALRRETAQAVADWIFEDIICRWGSLTEIVTDNGPAILRAAAQLSKKYHIDHIRISGYNSRANGIVEHAHYDV